MNQEAPSSPSSDPSSAWGTDSTESTGPSSWTLGRQILAAVTILAGFTVAYLTLPGGPQSRHAAEVLTITGPSDLAPGDALEVNAVLETNEGNRLTLGLAEGSEAQVGSNSRLVLHSGSLLTVERGTVYLEGALDRWLLEVRTSLGIVRDIDRKVAAHFEVRMDEDGLHLQVWQGSVELESNGQEHMIQTGEAVAVSPSGVLRNEQAQAEPMAGLGS